MTHLQKQKKLAAFRGKCVKAGNLAGIGDPYFVEDKGCKDDEFEDDGVLHIRRIGLRAIFDVGNGQSASGADQNQKTRAVMEAMGMTSKISDRVLVEEDEECEDEYCPHCGRGGG